MNFKDFRQGRKVRGPGTETSDSIPAMLSKNEFVIKAKSAKKIGYGKLAYMNRKGEIPMKMQMKKSNPKQASDMGAAMRGGGRMKLKGYQFGGKTRQQQLDEQERAASGEPPAAPDVPPKVPAEVTPTPAAAAAPAKPKQKPWYRRFFADGGGVMRCAACGGKMSSGGKCMACGGKVAAGLRGAKSMGANR